MLLLSHPTGNAFARALLSGLMETGLLGQFVTSLAIQGDSPLLRCLPESLRRELLRRKFDVPPDCLSTHPMRELCRLAASKAGARFLTRQETGPFCVDAVYRAIDHAVARDLPETAAARHLTGVYCYEDGALETFRAARALGLRRFYDLPIAYWETSRRLMEEELERVPEWKTTMEAIKDSDGKTTRKAAELELADTVICPSRFVRDTLPDSVRSAKPCLIAPFGSPPPRPEGNRPSVPGNSPPGLKPLRVLFAGSMSQRKGLADVFSAMKLLRRSDVELIVFGSPIAPMSFYRQQLANFTYEPPRPHGEVLRLMETCDLLVLPSIVEGRALVQQEALRCGLPLIVTPNAGGEDLIEEGRTGFLVPIHSPSAIAEKIDWFASHRPELEAMRPYARATAASLTWAEYARTIIDAIRDASRPL